MSRHFAESLRHSLNPLHLYCRLCDLGLSNSLARSLTARYERLVYRPLAT